jgi:competence protein ComEA
MKSFSRSTAVAVAVLVCGILFAGEAMAAAKGKPAPASKVNLNQATAQQLTVLPGVGPKLAERIVEYRQKSGGFHSTQEVMNVKGLGEKGLARIQAYIVVSAETAKADTKAASH